MVINETADVAIPELAGVQRRAFAVGAVAALVSAIGLFVNVDQFLQSYLMAFMWCLGVTLGSLALGMVHQLSGGSWGVVLRRQIGAAAGVLPVVAALCLRMVVGAGHRYTWTYAAVLAA